MKHLKTFEQFVYESYSSKLGLKKNKWEKLKDSDREYIKSEFYDLISIAYSDIGGHSKIRTPEDVFSDPDWNYWQMIDIDEDPYVDIIIFGQKGKYGVKYSGVGHDGERASKRKYVDDRGKDLKVKGYYGEVSGKFSEILLKKYNVPTVDNKEDVVKILGKDVEFHGRHPEDPNMPGLGWYTRMLGGHPHTKIIVGRPKV
jgi:hypothetical protein